MRAARSFSQHRDALITNHRPMRRSLASLSCVVSLLMALVGTACTASSPPTVAATVEELTTNETVRVNASDGVAADHLGTSVAISGDTMVVGAPDVGASDVGAAYVFVRDAGGAWSQQARLAAPGTLAFGMSVAISGNTIVVGAPYTASFDGAAYVYVRSGTVWALEATIASPSTRAQFGWAVAVAGNAAVITAPGGGPDVGRAMVYTRTGTTWTFTQNIDPATGAGFAMYFGGSVSFDGTYIAIGAPRASVSGMSSAGLAYVFGPSCFVGAGFQQEAQITASDVFGFSEFGTSVSLSGSSLLVGAPRHVFADTRGQSYVYTRTSVGAPCPTVTWTEEARLRPSDSMMGDYFGRSVWLDGNRALIGGEGRASFAGAGYYFTRAGTVWSERTNLVASDAGLLRLGTAAALGPTYAALGATGAPRGATLNTGGVYIFDVSRAPNGGTCGAASECASNFCVDGVCCNSACGGGSANDCQACSVATGAAVDGTCRARASGSCDDGSACTTADVCGATGVCGGAPRVCVASDQCHVASCDPATGGCVDAPRANGSACDDGNGCTRTDTCQAAVCVGAAPVTCTALDACHRVGVCNPATGTCSTPTSPDGTACNDGNACTQTDSCVVGVCSGAAPVVCAALSQCHRAGVCNPVTGICANPTSPNGTACNDGNDCTSADVCMTGACSGSATVCTAPVCQTAGVCTGGACPATIPMADGTLCPGGVCVSGSCALTDAGMVVVDAGVDGGIDAAIEEPLDGGVDAGLDDAGTDDDAGGFDAGVTEDALVLRDVGPFDASSTDAGARDVGIADGAIDAAEADAAQPGVTGGSCGCRVGATQGSRAGTWLALGFVLVVLTRRRASRTRG